MSHQFCERCNRVRLTASGYLKTCLQYDVGAALAPLLSESDDVIRAAIEDAVSRKPVSHQFTNPSPEHREGRIMSQIGG